MKRNHHWPRGPVGCLVTLFLAAIATAAGPIAERTHYKPGDTVTLLVPGPVTITSNLNDTQTATGSFVASGFGGLRLTDQAGDTEVITVADNFWDVGVGYDCQLQTGLLAANGTPHWVGTPEAARAAGCNFIDCFFVSPDDYALHVGNGQWMSGQTRYNEQDSQLLEFVDDCHKQGVSAALYWNIHPMGPVGYALTLQHPEFFVPDAWGNPGGAPPDLANYARWNDPTFVYSPPFNPFVLDVSRPDVVNYGLDAIVASVLRYRWDAARADGHFTVPGNPSLSARNMLMVRERLDPYCKSGFNFGKGGNLSAEGAVALAGGGAYIEEKGASAAQRYLVASYGGSYYAIQTGDLFSHPFYGNINAAPFNYAGPARSNFLRGFSQFIVGWNRALAPAGGGFNCVAIDGTRYYVQEIQTPGTYTFAPSVIGLPTVITPENGAIPAEASATITTCGLVVYAMGPPNDPPGTIRCVANRGWSGYACPIGGDGRQIRADLSTGVQPQVGVSNQGPFAPGSYKVSFRVWVEPGSAAAASCQLRFSISTMGIPATSTTPAVNNVELLVGYAHTPDVANPANGSASLPIAGALYQDYSIGTFTITTAQPLQARFWPIGACTGAAHLDSVAFVPVSGP